MKLALVLGALLAAVAGGLYLTSRSSPPRPQDLPPLAGPSQVAVELPKNVIPVPQREPEKMPAEPGPDDIIRQFRAEDPIERENLLAYLRAARGWSVAQRRTLFELAITDPAEDVRLASLEHLAADSFPDSRHGLEAALADASEEVRAQAIEALVKLAPAGVGDILSRMTKDSSERVRDTLIEEMPHLPIVEQRRLAESGLVSPHADLRMAMLDGIWEIANEKLLRLIFPMLDSRDADERSRADLVFETLFERGFARSGDAEKWWAKNRKNYDQELNPKAETPGF